MHRATRYNVWAKGDQIVLEFLLKGGGDQQLLLDLTPEQAEVLIERLRAAVAIAPQAARAN